MSSKEAPDLSRRWFITASATGAASLAGWPKTLLAATPKSGPLRVAWSTPRACPGDTVHALAQLPAQPDGQRIVFEVTDPGGQTQNFEARLSSGRASRALTLALPPSHHRPGVHRFELSVRLDGDVKGPSLGRASLELVANSFHFGL